MPARWLLLWALLLACPAGQAAAQAPEPLPVQEVAPGVFVHRGVDELMSRANQGAIANLGFVVGGEAVAVIDGGGSALEGRRLRAAIAARTARPVRYVINTHVHPDHVFGNAAFRGADVVFVGHHKLPRALAARGAYYLQSFVRSMGEEALAGTEIVPPGLLVEDELTLDLGGRPLHLKAYPTAHTDNDLTVFDQASGTLFTGDLLFARHLPVLDGSLRGWLKAIDALETVAAARVVPGHGPLDLAWPQALEPQARYLSLLARETREIIDQGGTLAEAAARVGQSARGRWALFDDFNARNVSAAFAELEWE